MRQKSSISRRAFVETSAGAAIALASGASAAESSTSSRLDPKGLPTRLLGKTGVRVPLIAFGTGTRFLSIRDEDEALELLNHALDNGIYYWDTASSYTNGSIVSEERLGKVLKTRRKEVFLATKAKSRTVEGVKAELETSLKRLNTDHLDLFQIHTIGSMDEVEAVSQKNGVVDFAYRMKEEGVVKHIGFTGHKKAEALKAMAERHNFETMLVALDHFGGRKNRRELSAIPAAHQKDMGIMVMKVVRPRETVKNIEPAELIRYGLSLPHVSGAVIAMDSMEVVNKNLELMRTFKPLAKERFDELNAKLEPFYDGKDLPWLQSGYQDGVVV